MSEYIQMNGKVLFDTNIVIALFANDQNILEHLNEAEEVFVPIIVLGELHFGARKSELVRENLARIDALAMEVRIADCDTETARLYGEIKSSLRGMGRPIPDNDMWIAAVARQHDLTLVTRDPHFSEIPGLRITSW